MNEKRVRKGNSVWGKSDVFDEYIFWEDDDVFVVVVFVRYVIGSARESVSRNHLGSGKMCEFEVESLQCLDPSGLSVVKILRFLPIY